MHTNATVLCPQLPTERSIFACIESWGHSEPHFAQFHDTFVLCIRVLSTMPLQYSRA